MWGCDLSWSSVPRGRIHHEGLLGVGEPQGCGAGPLGMCCSHPNTAGAAPPRTYMSPPQMLSGAQVPDLGAFWCCQSPGRLGALSVGQHAAGCVPPPMAPPSGQPPAPSAGSTSLLAALQRRSLPQKPAPETRCSSRPPSLQLLVGVGSRGRVSGPATAVLCPVLSLQHVPCPCPYYLLLLWCRRIWLPKPCPRAETKLQTIWGG